MRESEVSDVVDINDLKQIPGFVQEESFTPEDEGTDENLKDKEKPSNKEEEKKDEFEDLANKVNRMLDKGLSTSKDDEDEEDEKDESNKSKKDKKEASLLDTLHILREKKVIEYDDPAEDEEPYNEDEAEEILENAISSKVEEMVEDKIKGLDNITKAILKYSLNGGDVSQFIKSLQSRSTSTLASEPDLTKKENQEAVIKETLEAQGFDNEYIDEQLEWLKDSGKLKTFAEKQYKIWKENNEKSYQREMEEQEARKIEMEKRFRETKNRIHKTINSAEEIGGMKISNSDKKELAYYLLERTVKVQDAPNITKFHADLGDVLRNETASIQLAKLLRNRDKNGNFDFEIIKKDIETKVTREMKNNIRRKDSNIPASSKNNRSNNSKSLIDFLS
jgi:hypothetical protein